MNKLLPKTIFTLEMQQNSVNKRGFRKAQKLKKHIHKFYETDKTHFQIGRIDFKDIFDKQVLLSISKVQFEIRIQK